MDTLTKNDIMTLIEACGWPCVSIFLPTYRAGAETRQNVIRFKNQLQAAETWLIEKDLRSKEREELIAPLRELLDDDSFWQHQSDGLAIFVSPDMFQLYRLPHAFKPLANVGNRFHIKPLLPLLSGDGKFYVLALSGNEIRLLEGSHYSVNTVELEDVPKSLAEALRFEDPEKQVQYHTRAEPGGRGSRRAIFHGHGVGVDDERENLLEYFRQVDQGLHDILKEETAPLLLAGVESLFPIYREVNSYNHLLGEGVPGNPEALRAEELHDQAWKIVAPHFQKAQREAAAQYHQLSETEQASNSLKDIVPAAHAGRVDCLFVTLNGHKEGTFNPTTREIQLDSANSSHTLDLLDYAAAQTLTNGGTVYAVDPECMPDAEEEAPICAVFRY